MASNTIGLLYVSIGCCTSHKMALGEAHEHQASPLLPKASGCRLLWVGSTCQQSVYKVFFTLLHANRYLTGLQQAENLRDRQLLQFSLLSVTLA